MDKLAGSLYFATSIYVMDTLTLTYIHVMSFATLYISVLNLNHNYKRKLIEISQLIYKVLQASDILAIQVDQNITSFSALLNGIIGINSLGFNMLKSSNLLLESRKH